MNEIRWGIFGTGNISTTFVTALKSVKEAKAYAIASRSMKRAYHFSKKFEMEEAYCSYEELVENSSIDIVYIGTPHTEHYNQVKLCIEAGKHVLCEKPFSMNAKETQELIELAKVKKVFLMEAMWTKCLPTTLAVQEWICMDRIGQITCMNMTFGFRQELSLDSRLYNIELGGGALLDLGIYPITYAVTLLNSYPNRIESSAKIGITGVDEINSVTMEFEEDAFVTFCTAINSQIGSTAIITGTKGKIVVDNFYRAERAELYDCEENLLEFFQKAHEVNGYEYEIKEVHQCLQKEEIESTIHPMSETYKISKIMDEIRRQWNLIYPGGR